MVFSSHTSADGRLHESGQRRQHVDRRIYLSVMQVSVDVYLALSNITGQVGDRVSDIIVRHGKDRQLSDRSVFAVDPSSSLVDCTEISVQVPRIRPSTRYLLSGGGHFSK